MNTKTEIAIVAMTMLSLLYGAIVVTHWLLLPFFGVGSLYMLLYFDNPFRRWIEGE